MSSNDWYSNYNILIFDEIDSAFDEAKRIAKSNAEGNIVIWTNKQSSGKGINAKNWISDEGNLFLSILNKKQNEFLDISYIPFIIAVSIGQVLTKYIKPENTLQYKWPNDILIDNKKIASTVFDFDELDLIIGININLTKSPKNLNYPSTCLQDLSCSNNIILELVIDELMQIINLKKLLCKQEGFKKIRDSWLQRCCGVKQNIIFNANNARISGIFENINLKGEMELKLANGDLVQIPANEVFFKRNLFLENFFTI